MTKELNALMREIQATAGMIHETGMTKKKIAGIEKRINDAANRLARVADKISVKGHEEAYKTLKSTEIRLRMCAKNMRPTETIYVRAYELTASLRSCARWIENAAAQLAEG